MKQCNVQRNERMDTMPEDPIRSSAHDYTMLLFGTWLLRSRLLNWLLRSRLLNWLLWQLLGQCFTLFGWDVLYYR